MNNYVRWITLLIFFISPIVSFGAEKIITVKTTENQVTVHKDENDMYHLYVNNRQIGNPSGYSVEEIQKAAAYAKKKTPFTYMEFLKNPSFNLIGSLMTIGPIWGFAIGMYSEGFEKGLENAVKIFSYLVIPAFIETIINVTVHFRKLSQRNNLHKVILSNSNNRESFTVKISKPTEARYFNQFVESLDNNLTPFKVDFYSINCEMYFK